MNKFICLVLPFIWSVSSCASSPTNFSVSKPGIGKGAVVYIYRPDSLSNILISPMVIIDGDKKINITNNSYMDFRLSAGSYQFRIEVSERYEGKHNIDLALNDGEIYFLRVDSKIKFKMNELYGRRFDISHVPNKQALSEIGECQNLAEKQTRKTVYVSKEAEKDSDGIMPEEVDQKPGSILIDDPASRFSILKTRDPFSK